MYGAKPGILADSTSSSSLYHMHVSYIRYIPQFLANMWSTTWVYGWL